MSFQLHDNQSFKQIDITNEISSCLKSIKPNRVKNQMPLNSLNIAPKKLRETEC